MQWSVGEEEWISLCGENYLPDLGNEKDSDQILFEQKVFRANEKFIEVNKALIRWFKSPANSREYPKVCTLQQKCLQEQDQELCLWLPKGHIVQESNQ